MALSWAQTAGIVVGVLVALVILIPAGIAAADFFTRTEPPSSGVDSATRSRTVDSLKNIYKKLTSSSETTAGNEDLYSKGWIRTLTTPFVILIYFLPYFVGFYAIFSDIMTSTMSLSFGVVVGFGLNLINYVISKLFGPNIAPSDLCGLPGLTGLNSSIIPQAPLFVSAVTSYIATNITLTQGTESKQTYASWGLWGAFAIAQYFTLFQNRTTCLEPLMLGIGSPIVSIGQGLLWGGLSSYLVQKYYFKSPSAGPSLIGPGGVQRLCPDGTVPGPGGTCPGTPLTTSDASSAAGVGTCSPPNDQDQFVCETYKDGKLVTSTVASS